jgi:hypothetical protein
MANIEGKPCDCAGVSQSAEGIDCSGVPVGKGWRTVYVEMSGELFDRFTTVAKVRRETLGCVARKAVGNYIKRCQQDPGFRQEVEDLAIRLDRYSSSSNLRESK